MAGPRVIVVGAGPAGTRAAERLAAAGLRPVVIDEGRASGGQIYRRQPAGFRRPARELYGFEAARATAVHDGFDALGERIDYRPDSVAWALRDGRLHVASGGTTAALPYDALILAVGATDRVMPVPGWTLPGVTTLGGAQIALKAQGCTVGSRPVFLGTGPLLVYAAYQYARVGVRPAAILDTSPFSGRLAGLSRLAARPAMLAKGLLYTASLAARRVPMIHGATPLAIEGTDRVAGLTFLDAAGRTRRVACDAVALGYGLRSETQLADLAGCRFAFDPLARQWLPETDPDGRTSVDGVYLAGDGARITGADAAEIGGRLAACAVLADAGDAAAAREAGTLRARMRPMLAFREGLERAFPWPARLARTLPDETLVCRCEAITAGDLRRTQDLGATEVNRAKAFCRVGMGRCQGRYCGLAGAEILADALGVPVAEVGRLRGQAPVKPLPAGTTVETVP
ncbi:NAD(P)/FAD-dependent oxidoreductase [uncultured Methylobacterium sp.]|jgi:NADPH-dependent 2,4-dienoyl-CoA reductase/sulfur reductase-like enzyme|uniref:FAD/NAD(P)-dependent oxidoreductase n=1 Tax=uncultured Methylobacterium sp. TaxID=157278 RepID=UPI00261FA6A1|nr:NAD(P)/FAD-dependent oxidoreductase [uncultured Methylobacterium sp.]